MSICENAFICLLCTYDALLCQADWQTDCSVGVNVRLLVSDDYIILKTEHKVLSVCR